MSTFLLYTIFISDTLKILAFTCFLIGVFLLFLAALFATMETDIRDFLLKNKPKILLSILLLFLLSVLLPTTKQGLILAGVSTISDIDEVGKLPNKSVKALNKLLDGYLED